VSQEQAMQVAVSLSVLRKSFGDVHAVDGVDLDIADGEFFSMLGPSGSGKTTILRMIAGFELPTSGTIHLSGKDVTRLAPFQRDVNTVFQDYALFPHMNVLENIAYGLKVKRVAKKERLSQAQDALETVRLPGYGDRKPSQLSGGQRQRVALARALVNRPSVLLLDEPLGALDLKLRRAMQLELKQLQRDVGVTFVFVTHDQEEAFTMSDRIAVISEGRIDQVGTPEEIYESPSTEFVADFVGTSNLISGTAAERITGSAGTYSVRPEKIQLRAPESTPDTGESSALGTVSETVFTGPAIRYLVELDDGGAVTVIQPNDRTGTSGPEHVVADRVRLVWRTEHTFPISEGARVSENG
jgi:putative spermidine/putrescine transport system ATP-binding protein